MMGSRPPREGYVEALASSISESLLTGRTPEEKLEGLYVDDVQLEISDFDADVRLLSYQWERLKQTPVFPMVRQEGSLVPVALRQLVSAQQFFYPEFRHAFENVVPIRIEEARGIFRRLVAAFLLTRIQSVVDFFQNRAGDYTNRVPEERVLVTSMRNLLGAATPAVGFKVDVATKTPNVRIHSSLKIRRNWSYFGFYAGTKPVLGSLLGGIYEFGVERHAGQVIPDSAQFDIPYKTLSPRLLV